MIVKELIEKLKEFDEDLEVYVSIYNEVAYYGGESGQLVDDKYINNVEFGYQPKWNGPNKPCVILS